MACGQACQCTGLLQLRVLRLGFLQDGDVGVGVLPEGEEVLVRSLRFDLGRIIIWPFCAYNI